MLNADSANLAIGGNGAEGDIILRDANKKDTVHLDGGDANLRVGGHGHNGDIGMYSDTGDLRIHIDGGTANMRLGGGGASGDLALLNGEQAQTLFLDGGDGSNGDIALFSDDGLMRMHIDGGRANIYAGGEGAAGDIALKDKSGETVIHLDAGDGVIRIRGDHVKTADFVFADDYALAPLSDVEAHISAKGHLPGVPSAAEMREEGVDLNAMNAVLLQKVEELTLHAIDQARRIAALEAKLKG